MLPDFYPRPPRGGRRARWNPLVLIPVFLSTPSARRATAIDVSGQIGRQISIHALREEGDQEQLLAEINRRRFLSTPSARRATQIRAHNVHQIIISIHALREEGDSAWSWWPRRTARFLSTPSARRATHGIAVHRGGGGDFYPRPPRGGRLCSSLTSRRSTTISIHALREEGDDTTQIRYTASRRFLSTPSARRATRGGGGRVPHFHDFYPRPPRGGRQSCWRRSMCARQFLSTPSARRATTALSPFWSRRRNFYPRPPRGGRPLWLSSGKAQKRFLSTPSARRATIPAQVSFRPRGHFYPRPPRGGRQSQPGALMDQYHFYPRPPRGGRPDGM